MPVAPLETDAAAQWRSRVLEATLRVTSWLVPVVVAALVVLRDTRRFDAGALTLSAVSALLIALRLLPQLGFRTRAIGFLIALQCAGITTIASSGLLPGGSMAALITVVLSAIFFGRRAMLGFLIITPVAYLLLGALVSHGLLSVRADDADPAVFRHWVRVANTTALLSGLLGVAVEYVVRQVETNYQTAAAAATALRTAYDQLGGLHRRLELAKEEERGFLARELHDEMGQTLTVLKLRLQLLFRGKGASSAQPPQSDELIALVDGLISRVRKISVDLRPALLDELGLEPALSAFVETQARHSGLAITLHAHDIKARFSPELEHAGFRVVQEAVTNALRHAKATRVDVDIRHEQECLRIRVTDDGGGVSPDEVAAKAAAGHIGVVGMRERVRLLGGEFSLQAAGTGERPGTCVSATLPATPLPPPEAEPGTPS